jgi:sigma-B regulation protein RsbU (phosphoserine phosphatase)
MMHLVKGTSPITRADPRRVYGACVARIIEGAEYVEGNVPAKDVAGALRERPEIHVLGVMGEGGLLGVLDREAFFASLGRPYGWDILAKEPISAFASEVRTFGENENIFAVAAELRGDLEAGVEDFYGVIGDGGSYRGVFSGRSVLFYLASLTQKDMEMAGAFQERLVKPRYSSETDRFSFRAYSRAAHGMGGDFYFAKTIGRQRHFIAIGDVSGKGASASIVTSLLWGMFRTFDFRLGLKALLREVNDAVVQTFHLERHLTGVFMVWDFEAMNASIADMGHGMRFLIREGRYLELKLPQANLPLGIDPDIEARVFRFPVRSGDIFCAYTDGLVEQRNPDGEELGSELIEELAMIGTHSPEDILDAISRILDGFRVHMPQTDDATWIQIEVK